MIRRKFASFLTPANPLLHVFLVASIKRESQVVIQGNEGLCPCDTTISGNRSGYDKTSQLSQLFRVVLGPSPTGSNCDFPAHRLRSSVQPLQVGSGFILKKYGRIAAPLVERRIQGSRY